MRTAVPFALAAALLGAACTTTPPQEIDEAELALRDAETSGAAERAPQDLALARQKLERARRAAREDDVDRARRLAAEATVDAQLAEVRAEADAAATSRLEIERRLRPR